MSFGVLLGSGLGGMSQQQYYDHIMQQKLQAQNQYSTPYVPPAPELPMPKVKKTDDNLLLLTEEE